MPSRRLSAGSCNLAGAVFAATTFSYSDGKLSSGTRRKGWNEDGGDDGARTRDLRRDRFKVWARQINDLPVLSVA